MSVPTIATKKSAPKKAAPPKSNGKEKAAPAQPEGTTKLSTLFEGTALDPKVEAVTQAAPAPAVKPVVQDEPEDQDTGLTEAEREEIQPFAVRLKAMADSVSALGDAT